MYLIVGLGNPGEKYKNNRHNVGFQFIDYLIENLQFPNPKFQKKLHSEIYQLTINNQQLTLAKPQTFMNLSGQAVKQLSKVYGPKSNNLIIVHDDLDIPLGKFKIQTGVGPRLHNGIESIEKTLKTKDFWRVRIGVDKRPARNATHSVAGGKPESWTDGETYVLQNFKWKEKEVTNQTFSKIYDQLGTRFFTQD